MSKHVDLIAIAFLLLAFVFAGRLHGTFYVHPGRPGVVRVNPVDPMSLTPPRLPPVPRFPRLPHLPRV
jgi:hypothetical protein